MNSNKTKVKSMQAFILVMALLGSSISALAAQTENDYVNYHNVKSISETEVKAAKLERMMSPEKLGYDADSIIVVYDKNSIGASTNGNSAANVEDTYDDYVIHNGDEGAEKLIEINNYEIISVNINDNRTVNTAIEEYEAMEGVAYAQPNYLYYVNAYKDTAEDKKEIVDTVLSAASIESLNDIGRSKQWYLDSINAPAAWNIVKNTSHSKVRVCVLDTGCALNHQDLSINSYLSKEIVYKTGGFDIFPLKGEGYYKGIKSEGIGHGTTVAGVIGAKANNLYGVAGVASCYDNSVVEMVVVDVFEEYDNEKRTEKASTATIIKGLDYAMEIDAQVVNMSISGYHQIEDTAYKNACNKLYSNGIVVVAAAGNDYTDAHVEPSDFASVISVMATDKNNNKTRFSNYGASKDICAPGLDIWTTSDITIKSSDFTSAAGTSYSAPIVTGIVAMMLSVNPKLTPDQVKSILCETATDLGTSGKDNIFGYGLVNAEKSVKSSMIKATGVYPIYNEASVTLGCVHEGGCTNTKYRWEYCNMSQSPNSWVAISDWSTSEWCTWYPDANEVYAVVCKASYQGDGVIDSQTVWYVNRPQMTTKLTGTCVMPSGNGILLGCTANTEKYYTSLYIYDYSKSAWIISANFKGAACWYQANGLAKGRYMVYFCTEEKSNGRKLSTSYYDFIVK